MDDRRYDVVLFGATGFTGGLTARYLARHAGGARWAIAGRNPDKLEALKRELVALDPACESVGVVVADVGDDRALEAMAASTRVVLTTAGPFARYGEPVARACVLRGASYADITGEPDYVKGLLKRYGELARDKRLRIVSCCGFDSIPPDLGVYYTVKQLPKDVPIRIEGFVRGLGIPSGGTWRSAVDGMAGGQRPPRDARTPAEGGRRVGRIRHGLRRVPERGGWAVPFPTIDPVIVLRSAKKLAEYGPDFRYGHFVVFPGLPQLAMLGSGVAAMYAAAQLPPTRKLLYRMRQSGEGPSPEQRAKSWFDVTFVAEAGEQRLVTRVGGGDPGYDETAKMCSEAALCLALDGDRLPDRYGVLTPAAAMGDALLERLMRAGLRFETLERG